MSENNVSINKDSENSQDNQISKKKIVGLIIWIVIAVVLVFGTVIVYNNYKPDDNNTITSKKNTNSGSYSLEVPDFTLESLNGETFTLSDFKGKNVVINFWATWCQYCVVEMPDFNNMHNEFKKDDETVILAIDVAEEANLVSSFVSDHNLDLNVLMDYDGKVAEAYNIPGFPSTYIIDKNGKLIKTITGMTNKETVMKILGY